jgi:DNA-binding NarL/FixJ family response regulator
MAPVPAPTPRAMVGRDDELRELTDLLGIAAAGVTRAQRQAVLLSGDAGVGKTRLLVALRDHAHERDWRVLAGHCLDFGDSALPYLPFSEILGRLEVELPEVVERVATIQPTLGRLLPGRRGLETEPSGENADRGALFAAVHALLEQAALDKPLLLVVEDCHWADQSTRDLLTFLFTRGFEGPVALVASYRSDDLHRRHPLRRQVAEWSRLSGVERVALAPLGDADVRRLIADLDPATVDEAKVSAIVTRADGNAFFVEELVGAASQPGSWVPDDLADVLLVRLDRLGDSARQVVRVASVAGRKVSHDLLAAAAGLPAAELEEGLRQAVEMNLLVPGDGTYSFRHALLGEAVYDDLLPGERVRLHAQYAEALRAGRAAGSAAELARHARLAHDLDTALDAAIRAGDEAMAVAGADEAARHFEQALELLADPARREASGVDVPRLAVRTAEVLSSAGRPHRAAALLAEQIDALPADASDDLRARLLAARAGHEYVIESTYPELPLDLVQEAAGLLGDDTPGPLRASVLAIRARILTGFERYDEAQASAFDALELAERYDLSELAAEVHITLSQLNRTGPTAGLREALATAVEHAVEAGAVHAEVRARYFLGRSHQDFGDWAGAEEWFRSAMTAAARAGVPYAPHAFESRWQLALVEYVTGDWDELLRIVDTRREQVPEIPAGLLESGRLLVEAARGQDVAERARALRPLWELEGGIAISSVVAEITEAARDADWHAVLEVNRDVTRSLGRIWHEWFSARIRINALTIGALADRLPGVPTAERAALMAEVERLDEEGHVALKMHTDPAGHWGPEGRAWVKRLDAETLRARWLAGTDAPEQEDLLQAWREAETLFADYGHAYELAVVRAVLASVLRATGDAAAARPYADQARDTARALGAQPLLERLRVSGSTPNRTDGPSDTLTARESEILALVAEGRTNGEIAKQLFISTKTVSVHVSNILGKLGASGRTEAAAIARRRGLLD